MDFNGLITIAGLFVAILAVLPRVRRLEISLGFGILGKITFIFTIIILLYLQFYDIFKILKLTPELGLSRWGITTSNASAIIVIIETVFIVIYFRISGISRFSIKKYKEYISQLIQEKSYTELFNFIQGKMHGIYKIYNQEHPSDLNSNFIFKIKKKIILKKLKKDNNILLKDLNSLPYLYKTKKPKIKTSFATDIIQEITKRRDVVEAIVEYRPYFAIELLKYDFYENKDFMDSFILNLADRKESILYYEIKNTTNIISNYEYRIPKNMKLLNFLFNDCKNAESYGVYKPIGEFVINFLDELHISKKPDPYNEPMRDFYDKGKWESELFLGINFFDRMVGSALAQNIQWHMWLFYFQYFIDRIINNIDPNLDLVDQQAEWPTRYHYAIYEIIGCLSKWITSVKDIDSDQENVKLNKNDSNYENENIPKSSMIAIDQILKRFLMTNKIDEKFKHYIMDIIFTDYFELKQEDKTTSYANFFRECMITGGNSYNISKEYKKVLSYYLDNADIPKFNIYDYEDLKSFFEKNLNI